MAAKKSRGPSLVTKQAIEVEEVVEVQETDISEALNYIGKARQLIGAAQGVLEETEYAGSQYAHDLFETREELTFLQERLGQIASLRKALQSVQFTTNPRSDAKIIKKVIDALQDKYTFIPISESDIVEDDVVIVDEPTISVASTSRAREEAETMDKDVARDLQDLQRLREEARLEAEQEVAPARALSPLGQTASPSSYERAFNSSGDFDFKDLPDSSLIEDLSEEEIAAFMGSQGDPALLRRAEELKRLAPKHLDATSVKQRGKNSSITRRS